MIKNFVSSNKKHIIWLAWGVKKLLQLTLASKMSGGGWVKKTYMPDDDVEITVDTPKNTVTVQELPVKHWFGAVAAVEPRCWCRGLVLSRTPKPFVYTVSAHADGFSSNPHTWKVYIEGGDPAAPITLVHSTQSGSLTADGGGFNHWENFLADYIGSWPGYLANGITGGGSGSGVSITIYPDTSGTMVLTPVTMHPAYIAAQAEAAAMNAAASAGHEERYAAFMTDAEELSSYILTPDQKLYTPHPWNGGSHAAMYELNSIFQVAARLPDLTFTVPEDACFTSIPTPPSYVFGSSPEAWAAEWAAAQQEGLEREQARRKKCSDGQLTYLRTGFLSPEFEVFIKTWHPLSALVRRDIPMQVISSVKTELSNTTIGVVGGYGTIVTQAVLSLKYITKDKNGGDVEHAQTFTGTKTMTKEGVAYTPGASDPVNIITTTYMGYPEFVEADIGSGYSLITGWTGLPGRVSKNVWHDGTETLTPWLLPVLVNGVEVATNWKTSSEFGTPAINPLRTYTPELPPSSAGVTFTHPPFVLDYMKASKSVEIDAAAVPPDVATTNWLSSRLAHNEIITIIPLSFVNEFGVDRGMHPYDRDDEPPEQIKLVGYARFKYNYDKQEFAFVDWTEFVDMSEKDGQITHDGSAVYDDETNPTAVIVNKKTYRLRPRFTTYNPEWSAANCVCYGSKTPWTDTKAARKTQKKNIAEGGVPGGPEERLYREIKKLLD